MRELREFITVRAKKEGKMQNGNIFCFKGNIYDAEVSPGTEEEGGDYYEVIDELCSSINIYPHEMDSEFFNEYFEVVEWGGTTWVQV